MVLSDGLLKNVDEIVHILLRKFRETNSSVHTWNYCPHGFDNCLWASKVALEG